MKRESSEDEDSVDSMSENDSVFEEEDVSQLSSLDNYQLCLKYQQVPVLNYWSLKLIMFLTKDILSPNLKVVRSFSVKVCVPY